MTTKTILVTGGAGYIGSHTCLTLQEHGYDVVVVDNLVNSSQISLQRVAKISGRDIPFFEVDLCDKERLVQIFTEREISAVIHFAGLKAVSESIELPLSYYRNNLDSTLSLCEVMLEFGVKQLIFSSSATVYGQDNEMPVKEEAARSCTNPYGWTKYMNEQILRDIALVSKDWSVVALRYFNPVGAHPSGLIGENPLAPPTNLMPTVTQVALGRQNELLIFGHDYDTVDGTGIRDYIHVVDLALGHVAALTYAADNPGFTAFNLGTGQGYSVLELVKAFQEVTGQKVAYKLAERRAGDLGICYADVKKARRLLGWSAQKGLSEMCRDAWRWQQMNPLGYLDAQTKSGSD